MVESVEMSTSTDVPNSKFNTAVQFLIPILTVISQLGVALKFPDWGMLVGLLAQPFWFYSAWQAYKKAGQVGLLITTCLITLILIGGLINYWWL